MINLGLSALADGLARGEYSSVELTRHCLERIERLNPGLNALVQTCSDSALKAAHASDQRRAQGAPRPLEGLPLVHKDIFCTDGVATTCASNMLKSFVPPYDATVVARLRDAGMVMLGKANMDEFAMGSSNENSAFGPARNPWDLNRVCGGSSGGSACAVAAQLAPVATGTDTGGSIRQPAALTGLTGIKPTYGRVSRYGMIAFASSLDQAGVLGHSAADAAMVLQHMAGFDPADSTSAEHPVADYAEALTSGVAGLKIGIVDQFFDDGLDSAVAESVHDAIAELTRLGAQCVRVSLPNIRYAVPTYYVVSSAECSSNLSRFDGVRFGHRCADPRDLHDLYTRSRAEGFGAEVKRRILTGTYVLSAGYYDAYYLKAQRVRRLISEDFQAAFAEVDVLVGPTTPTPAFGLGEKCDDPVTMYLNDIYTVGASLAGLPAMSLPCAPVNGLPVGLQLTTQHFDEARLFSVGHALQTVTGWHEQRAPDHQETVA
ncbi:MAG: Asp-tRNA(Asn)/Glu-tRNA(Gln) amidotransferase subunit GatA [Gammaproteobacteria bacterium]